MWVCRYFSCFSHLLGTFFSTNFGLIRTSGPHGDQSLILMRQNIICWLQVLLRLYAKNGDQSKFLRLAVQTHVGAFLCVWSRYYSCCGDLNLFTQMGSLREIKVYVVSSEDMETWLCVCVHMLFYGAFFDVLEAKLRTHDFTSIAVIAVDGFFFFFVRFHLPLMDENSSVRPCAWLGDEKTCCVLPGKESGCKHPPNTCPISPKGRALNVFHQCC